MHPLPELAGGEGRDATRPGKPGTSQRSGFFPVEHLLDKERPLKEPPENDPVGRPEAWR